MYRKTLRINLLGIADAPSAALEVLDPLDRFVHEWARSAVWDDQTFLASDIVVADAGALPSFGLDALVERRRQLLDEAFGAFVVVADDETLAMWTPREFALVDAVWPKPLDPVRAAFEFARLQREARAASDLRLARTYLDAAIDSSPELIWFKDIDGAHVKVNAAFCSTVQKTREQIEGRDHCYIWNVPPEEVDGAYACQQSEEQAMRAGCTCLFNEQVKTAHGLRQFKTYKTPLFDEDGRIMGTAGIGHDVTDLQNVATELEVFINSMPFAIVILDIDDKVLNINVKAEEYFCVSRSDAVGMDFDTLRRDVLGNDVVEGNDFADGSSFCARLGGNDKTLAVNDRIIWDMFGNKTGHLRIYRDITAERELEERAITNARTDYLTGLYNRRYFYEYLEERGRDEELALIALDLDDFKEINDLYGHSVGDEVLMKAGALLRETFPDGIAIRWGGDEFIVAVFGPHELQELRAQAEALLTRFTDDSKADGHRHVLTGSVGIAATDDPNLSIDELIRRGDQALYRAKRAGKSQCRVYEE